MKLDPELGDEQAALRDAVAGFFAKESPPEVVRQAESSGGFSASLWEKLLEIGIPAMATDAGLVELAIVAREAGRRLAPAPVVEAMVARRLGAAVGVTVPDLATVAVGPLVAYGSCAELMLACESGQVVAVDGPGQAVADLGAVGISRLPGGDTRQSLGAEADWAHAVDEWRVLTAAALTGLGEEALRLGVDYAQSRRQFGAPIGSYQAIQQRLADVATDLAGASLLVHHAAAEADAIGPRARELAAMALWWAAAASQSAALASLHVHGGYGYMLEYDVQLYFRRAKAWALVGGDPRRLAQVVVAERRRRPDGEHEAGSGWREEVRAFVAEHITSDVIARVHAGGTVHDWGVHRALAERGWLAGDRPADEMAVLLDEMGRAGAPVDGWLTTELVARTLELTGNAWQKSEVLPRILAGEILVCLGYSEPDSGSDVAAAKTRAVRDGDEWVISGQKMFTTMAQESAYVFLLARTNLDVAKHRGLTMFLVPTDAPGVEIRPIHTLGGERTNGTFYNDVRVRDKDRVGEVDGGWEVMLVALAFERQAPAWADCWRLLHAAELWAASRPELLSDPVAGERLARAAVEVEVGRLLRDRLIGETAKGRLPVVEGSMAKLFTSEALQRMSADLLDLVGPEGLLGGPVEQAFRHAPVTTIYAGTSEIQRSIIAERGLGLPRAR
jgi:alkylation response protein AidB-like acyl-CoA dehydrogenase